MKQVYYWLDSFTTAVNDLLQYIYGINLLHLTHVDVLWLTETVKWLSKFQCAILDHPISNTLMQHKYRHLLLSRYKPNRSVQEAQYQTQTSRSKPTRGKDPTYMHQPQITPRLHSQPLTHLRQLGGNVNGTSTLNSNCILSLPGSTFAHEK